MTDMNSVDQFPTRGVHTIFTDIDDTITDEGQLGPEAYDSLWRLHRAGMKIVSVTGRPAGWCEMIARFWPVHGVIGENGGFYFRYVNDATGKHMRRHFVFTEAVREANRQKLESIRTAVLKEVPGASGGERDISFEEQVEFMPGFEVEIKEVKSFLVEAALEGF